MFPSTNCHITNATSKGREDENERGGDKGASIICCHKGTSNNIQNLNINFSVQCQKLNKQLKAAISTMAKESLATKRFFGGGGTNTNMEIGDSRIPQLRIIHDDNFLHDVQIKTPSESYVRQNSLQQQRDAVASTESYIASLSTTNTAIATAASAVPHIVSIDDAPFESSRIPHCQNEQQDTKHSSLIKLLGNRCNNGIWELQQKYVLLLHKRQQQTDRLLAARNLDHYIYTNAEYNHPKKKKGRPAIFINRLYIMLMEMEVMNYRSHQNGDTPIVSFLQPEGNAFTIYKPEELMDYILPRYFKMKNLTSFKRQLNCYGFRQISVSSSPLENYSGGSCTASEKQNICKSNTLTYHHESFIRGQPQLLPTIRRISRKEKSIIRGAQTL